VPAVVAPPEPAPAAPPAAIDPAPAPARAAASGIRRNPLPARRKGPSQKVRNAIPIDPFAQ
jgi:hypothetical protein